jgi:hypothetical protein
MTSFVVESACPLCRHVLADVLFRQMLVILKDLPLGVQFSTGNINRDALHGRPLVVKGDCIPCRSYIYASALDIWLWSILFKRLSIRRYNADSLEGVSISKIAEKEVKFSLPTKLKIIVSQKQAIFYSRKH